MKPPIRSNTSASRTTSSTAYAQTRTLIRSSPSSSPFYPLSLRSAQLILLYRSALLEPRSFVGRAPEQTRKFIKDWVTPALEEPELKAALDSAMAGRVELTV